MLRILAEGEVALLFHDCMGARRGTSRGVGSEKVLPVPCISIYFTLQIGLLSPGAKGLKWTFFCHKSKLGHKL